MKIGIKSVFSIIVGALAISGCSSSNVKQSYSPSGNPSYEISCNNVRGTLNECYQKAGEICKAKGYNVILENSNGISANIIAECKK